MRKIWQVFVITAALLLIGGCGGTWVNDESNFKRIFGFDKPEDVQVQHSYYWKSAHWSSEFRYYIALRGSTRFANGLTAAQVMNPAIPDTGALEGCGDNPPQWFVSKPLSHYEMWTPKNLSRFRVFRDKDDGTIYVCDEQL